MPPEDDPVEPRDEPAPKRDGKRRLARFVLLGGALLAAAQLLPQLPRERHLALRIDEPASVRSVEVTWTREGRDEPVAGGSWRFEPGRAPRRLESTVRLPNGSYDLEVVVVREEDARTIRRAISLEGGDDLTVPVPR